MIPDFAVNESEWKFHEVAETSVLVVHAEDQCPVRCHHHDEVVDPELGADLFPAEDHIHADDLIQEDGPTPADDRIRVDDLIHVSDLFPENDQDLPLQGKRSVQEGNRRNRQPNQLQDLSHAMRLRQGRVRKMTAQRKLNGQWKLTMCPLVSTWMI